MRIATVDIGTNTVLLLVAERASSGSLRPVAERAVITRLGEGVDRTRRLSDAAVTRTLDCLREYATTLAGLRVERLAVVGTSAMRDAAGGEEMRAEVRRLLGVDVRVLSGDEEARLTFRGAIGDLPLSAGDEVAVFDIGGGSTEVVLGTPDPSSRVRFAQSFDIGSVRLTERYVSHDPPSRDEYDAIVAAARAAFAGVPALSPSSVPVGIAGTMTTLAAVSLGMTTYDAARIHGHAIGVEELAAVVDRLARLPVDARRRLPGMEPKRADVIVAGGAIALALMEHWKAPSMRISDRGVRWGLAEEMLEQTAS